MPDAEGLGRVSVCVCVHAWVWSRGLGREQGSHLGLGHCLPGQGGGSGLGWSGTAMSEKNGVILPES